MIKLSNDKRLLFLMASGMMGFDGRGPTWPHIIMYDLLKFVGLYDPSLFAIVTKTVSIKPVKPGNPGLSTFLLKNAQEIRDSENIIISIFAQNLAELQMFADKLKIITPELIAVELNVSCPNFAKIDVGDASLVIDMCYFWKEISQFPLILKIGKKSNYIKIAKKTEKIIQAIDINSVPDDNGGISGERAQFVNWKILNNLIEYTSIPVIGPNVRRYSDIDILFKKGAGAVSFDSCSPRISTKYVRKYLKGG